MKKTAIISIISAVFFISADRFFKAFAMRTDPDFPLLGDIFFFNYEKNPYIAFSIPLSGIILNVFISLIIILLLILTLSSYKKRAAELAPMIFIIAGAASNLYDRLRFGFVIDYLYLRYFTIFNIADCLIVAATAYLLWLAVKPSRK